jgi:ATP-dependent protease HslVU (ClpYQ) peptidase subunit
VILAPIVIRKFARSTTSGSRAAFSMIVVLDAKAFEVGFDGGVRRSLRGVVAIGAGESFALGALHALAQEPPERRVRAALAAAAEWSPHVVRPFHVVRV